MRTIYLVRVIDEDDVSRYKDILDAGDSAPIAYGDRESAEKFVQQNYLHSFHTEIEAVDYVHSFDKPSEMYELLNKFGEWLNKSPYLDQSMNWPSIVEDYLQQ